MTRRYYAAPDEPPKGLVRWRDRLKSFRLWVTVGSIALSLMGLVGFAEFMYEEAGQQFGFAGFILKTGGLANEAYSSAVRYMDMLDSMERFVYHFGWLSPFNWHAYKMWIQGARADAQALMQWAIAQNPVLAQSVPEAQVVSVIDGDSLVLSTGEEIRLAGIDAPEWYAPQGPAAKQLLASLVLGKTVKITRLEQGYYGRVIADLTIDGQDVGSALARAGLADITDPAKLATIDSSEGTTTKIQAQHMTSGYLILTGTPVDVFIADQDLADQLAQQDWIGMTITVKGKVKLYNGQPEVILESEGDIRESQPGD